MNLRHSEQTLSPGQLFPFAHVFADPGVNILTSSQNRSHSAGYFASLYKQHGLEGAHVIKLGAGNEQAALEALQAWPGQGTFCLNCNSCPVYHDLLLFESAGGLQLGGGVTDENAQYWLDAGASKVIVTSWLFPEAVFSLPRLQALSQKIGKDRLVVDLRFARFFGWLAGWKDHLIELYKKKNLNSCRRVKSSWFVAMNKWQTITSTEITEETLALMAEYCSEFLVHAADVEGLCQGIDQELVKGKIFFVGFFFEGESEHP